MALPSSKPEPASGPVFGVSSAISYAQPKPEDIKLTKELTLCLEKHDVFDTDSGLQQRLLVLGKLNELVNQWIYDISIEKGKSEAEARVTGGKICTFGSYRLGVHGKGADIDTLVIAPRHIERNDFFQSFKERLEDCKEVKHLRAIEDAFVPVIKLEFNGIEMDMLFARLALSTIPNNLDLLDINLLKNLDHKCVRSLNGCRVTDAILNLVPAHDNFKLALRAIKLWAKRRGVYSNALGFLGGVSWSMLVARTCQLYPNAVAGVIIQKFFFVFSTWNWPNPVLLRKIDENIDLGMPVWDPRINPLDKYHLMPIITPAYPQQNSTFNVSHSTLTVMKEEFTRGLDLCNAIALGKKCWDDLFEPVSFFSVYRHYMVITATAKSKEHFLKWTGLVESKIRILIEKLEYNGGIELAHVNCKTFNPESVMEEEECKLRWFIGLKLKKGEKSLDLTYEIQAFTDAVILSPAVVNSPELTDGQHVEVVYVKRKQLGDYLPSELVPPVTRKSKQESQDSGVAGKKRVSEEGSTQSSDIKRSRRDSLASVDDISMDSVASMASFDNSDSVMSCSISENINIEKVSSSSGSNSSTIGNQISMASSQELSDSIGGAHSNDLNKKNSIKINLKST